jgi:Glycosyltransferase family 87
LTRLRELPLSRPWLWIAGGIYVFAAAVSLLVYPLRGWPGGVLSIDFIDPLTAARILRTGSTCIYCAASQHAALISYVHISLPSSNTSSYLDPPLAGYVLQPLAGLDVHLAMAILFAISFSCLAVTWWLLFRYVLPAAMGVLQRVVVSSAAIFVLPSASSVWVGQWDPMLLLAAVVAVLLLKNEKQFASGLILSILLLKPQLVWLLPVALLSARQWRVLAGAAAGAFAWAVSDVLILGFGHAWDWLSAAGYSYAEGLGIPHILVLVTSSKVVATVGVVALPIIVFVVLERWGKNMRQAPELAIAAGIAASIACSPHVYDYDLLMLALPIALWARTRPVPALITAVCLRMIFALAEVVNWPTPLFVYLVWVVPVAIFSAVLWTLPRASAERQPA